MEFEEYKAAREAAVQPPVPEEARPRSGYARLRQRHRHLIAEHEVLRSEHQSLQRHHEALKAGHQELQTAFAELLEMHNGLLADLKQSHGVRSVAYGSSSPKHTRKTYEKANRTGEENG